MRRHVRRSAAPERNLSARRLSFAALFAPAAKPFAFLVFCLFFRLTAAETSPAAVSICYGYGCLAQVEIHYSPAQLAEIRTGLAAAADAAGERQALAVAVGRLYGWGGEQSYIHNDKGGNYADGHAPGKMDCIDHSTSTTRLLALLAGRGWLRWHRVGEREVRHFAWIFPAHWSASIEEIASGRRYAVDSWFVDNGEAAVILPLDEWKKGAGPDV